MKKDDYMKLSKERLAELLEERDNEQKYLPVFPPIQVTQPKLSCFEGGPCTNPFHDCINCPRQGSGGGYWTTSTGTGIKEK